MNITTAQECHYIMIKRSIHSEDIIIPTMHILNKKKQKFYTQELIVPEENLYSNYQSMRYQCVSLNIDRSCWKKILYRYKISKEHN